MHCTSIYPTPYDKVYLGVLKQLQDTFGIPVGLSDHSEDIYTSLASIALGACAIEKHFTVSKEWPGPDIGFSIDPVELSSLVRGSKAVFAALGGEKEDLLEEQPVKDFAFASVVSIKEIRAGDVFSKENIWVKKPGTGEIKAKDFDMLIGKNALIDIDAGQQITHQMIES